MRITRAPNALRALSDGPRLLADIGGTNARFGWQWDASKPIEKVRVMPCADHAQLLQPRQADELAGVVVGMQAGCLLMGIGWDGAHGGWF